MGKTCFIRQSLIFLIRAYRFFISPFLGNCCRFYPSCSDYSQQAIGRFGVARGLFLTTKRILCCHPGHLGGYDPIPDIHNKK